MYMTTYKKIHSIFFRLYVVLPMNGQGIYTTWTIIASLLNFGHALRYEAKYEMEYVSHVCLGLLIAVIIIYFILENLVLDNYIRLLLTPYLGMYLSSYKTSIVIYEYACNSKSNPF